MNITENSLIWLNAALSAEPCCSTEAELWAKLSEEDRRIFAEIRETILEQKRKTEELEIKLQYYLGAFNALPIPMAIKDSEARYLDINDEYAKTVNPGNIPFVGKDLTQLPFFSDEEKQLMQKDNLYVLEHLVSMEKDLSFSNDEKKRNYAYWLGGFETESKRRGLLTLYYDITLFQKMVSQLNKKVEDLETEQQDIIKSSSLDALTGAYNRSVMQEFLDKALEEAQKNGKELSLLMIDIDHFKKVNDTYGHLTGDQVLQLFVMLLQKTLRDKDCVIRYGGEEFLIILDNTKFEFAYNVAERIRKLAESNMVTPDQKPITVSTGIASFSGEESSEELLRKADENLYKAKNLGRNIVIPEA